MAAPPTKRGGASASAGQEQAESETLRLASSRIGKPIADFNHAELLSLVRELAAQVDQSTGLNKARGRPKSPRTKLRSMQMAARVFELQVSGPPCSRKDAVEKVAEEFSCSERYVEAATTKHHAAVITLEMVPVALRLPKRNIHQQYAMQQILEAFDKSRPDLQAIVREINDMRPSEPGIGRRLESWLHRKLQAMAKADTED